MFADDTNLFFKRKDLTTLFNIINAELSKILYWFKLNKLSLNIKKTKYIIFKSQRKINLVDDTQCIRIDNVKLEQVRKTKFLCVIINFSLSREDHIETVSNKVSKNVGLLCKIRRNLCSNTLLMLYRTLIQSYYEYCNIFWQ